MDTEEYLKILDQSTSYPDFKERVKDIDEFKDVLYQTWYNHKKKWDPDFKFAYVKSFTVKDENSNEVIRSSNSKFKYSDEHRDIMAKAINYDDYLEKCKNANIEVVDKKTYSNNRYLMKKRGIEVSVQIFTRSSNRPRPSGNGNVGKPRGKYGNSEEFIKAISECESYDEFVSRPELVDILDPLFSKQQYYDYKKRYDVNYELKKQKRKEDKVLKIEKHYEDEKYDIESVIKQFVDDHNDYTIIGNMIIRKLKDGYIKMSINDFETYLTLIGEIEKKDDSSINFRYKIDTEKLKGVETIKRLRKHMTEIHKFYFGNF
jgi:hypothetical protein